MSNPSTKFVMLNDEGRVEELLAAHAIDDMTPEEHAEFARWTGSPLLLESFDRAAATVFLAHDDPSKRVPMPSQVSKLLEATAIGWCAAVQSGVTGNNPQGREVVHAADDRRRPMGVFERRRAKWRIPLAGALAASLAVACWLLFARGGELDVVSQRASLVASANDLVRWEWSAWDNPAMQGVTGDVVWSDKEQRGYMRLTGLPVNDPTVEEYQLWIVDGRRGLESRFNGGVFDVTKPGEVIVPINSELKVDGPQLFAITVEKPGGTGISDMKRRAVLAKRPG
jgi:hypothetical protein